MARKKQAATSETATSQPVEVEQIPIVTPEIEDGYTGTIKRLVCVGCQRVFYVTQAVSQSLHPTHCHSCSTRLLAEYEAKKQREKTEQEQQAKDEVILALLDDITKPHEDTPEEAHIRAIVETKNKRDKNYGFKMFLCIPHQTEQGKAWDVILSKDEDQRRIHRRIWVSEMGTNGYFILPYNETIFYETSLEEEIRQLDAAIARHPTESIRYAVKAEKLAELGDNEQALQCYDKAIALDPSSTYAYSQKGKLLVRLERTGEAMECYEKVISLAPDDVSGYDDKARLLDILGREEEALALYDGFIAAHPTDLQGYLQKAIWYISHNQHEKAREIHLAGKRATQQAG